MQSRRTVYRQMRVVGKVEDADVSFPECGEQIESCQSTYSSRCFTNMFADLRVPAAEPSCLHGHVRHLRTNGWDHDESRSQVSENIQVITRPVSITQKVKNITSWPSGVFCAGIGPNSWLLSCGPVPIEQ